MNHLLILISHYFSIGFLAILPILGASLSYGFDADEDAGGESDGGSLASAILMSGTSLASEAILANANPTNAAILQGQTVITPTLTTGSPTIASAKISSSGFLVLLVIGVVIFLLVRK